MYPGPGDNAEVQTSLGIHGLHLESLSQSLSSKLEVHGLSREGFVASIALELLEEMDHLWTRLNRVWMVSGSLGCGCVWAGR